MSAKREKMPYAFVRRGDALIPEMEMDRDALAGIAQGQKVRIEIKEFRNLDRHRAYFAMLHDVIEATDGALSPERLHDLVKLHTGAVEVVMLPNGTPVALPGSIAFDKMDEPEFVKFFRAAELWLARTYGYAGREAA